MISEKSTGIGKDEAYLAEPKDRTLVQRKRKRKQKHSIKSLQDQTIESIEKFSETFDPEDVSSINSFDSFPLSERTRKGLRDAGFEQPTDIQRQSIGHSILGRDVVGAAKTGSGKTLAFLIPLLECLWKNRWSRMDGLGSLIITPTRELAYQIYQVLNQIGKHHEYSVALLIGGTDVEFEKTRLMGIHIVICTPGRLLQHMDENEHFSCDQLQMMVIDEADRILDMGFRKQIDAIIANLPAERQTLLFSATMAKKVEDLVRISLRSPIFLSTHEHSAQATPAKLAQTYMVCQEHEKINFLWSFLKTHTKMKTLVFVTCCKQARFLTEAIAHLRPGLYFTGLWGELKQSKRMERFQRFDGNTKGGAMICTDVASRGLDFKGLDWVLQLDCPPTVDDYIHRVGRTARMNSAGQALLVLTPNQEEPFVRMLEQRNVPIQKIEVVEHKLLDLQKKLTNLMIPFPELKDFAQRSFVAYARAIYFMKLKELFDVGTINFDELARSYGLPQTPRIRFLRKKGINVSTTRTNGQKVITTCEEVVLGNETDGQGFGDADDNGEEGKEEEEDFLKLSRKDVFGEIEEVDTKEEVLARMSSRKPITKAEMVKKMVRRLGPVSKRKRFTDEERDEEED